MKLLTNIESVNCPRCQTPNFYPVNETYEAVRQARATGQRLQHVCANKGFGRSDSEAVMLRDDDLPGITQATVVTVEGPIVPPCGYVLDYADLVTIS